MLLRGPYSPRGREYRKGRTDVPQEPDVSPQPDVPQQPRVSPEPIRLAAQRMRSGGVVAYPSETVWGLAAHPERPDAIEALYTLKGRDPAKPLQVSCDSVDTGLRFALPDPRLEALAGFWPGPLTVVTPARPDCPAPLAPAGKVGLRVPDHPVALALLRACGGALVTTSCNRSGEPAATTEAQAAATGLGDLLLPDGGVPARGLASTVVLLPEGVVVREGELAAAQVRAALAGTEPG